MEEKMTFKVAVASTDKKNVNEHFGKAKEFLIYKIEDNGTYRFLEIRENIPQCNAGKHQKNKMEETLDIIKDVKILLVSNICPGAIELVISKEIKPYATSFTIENAMNELIKIEKNKIDKRIGAN
jgi:nitrogen fixation protein NifX